MAYLHIDFHDIPKALRAAGSNRLYVDQGDYEKVAREVAALAGLSPAPIGVDEQDVSELIIGAQAAVAADVTVPAVASLDPLDDATGIVVSKQPLVTFAETVIFGSGSFKLFKTTGDVLVHTWNVPANVGSGPGQVRMSGPAGVVLRPPANLAAATEYYITWTSGVVRDIAGNGVAAQASTTAWSFTTA